MERTTGYYNTFVVKIWRDEAEGIIRGHIQHVSTQEHTYFLSVENMTDFIVSHLGPPSHYSTTQDRIQGGAGVVVEDFGDMDYDRRP